MAKSSVEAYGAQSKVTALAMDPNDLELVMDPSHPLYDRRVHQEPNPKTVQNYRAIGVRKPVLFYKDPETGKNLIIDGRTRVINARELNRQLVAAGEEPITIPAIPQRTINDGGKTYSAVMVSTNEIRKEDSPINRAEKMARMLDAGHTEETVAVMFGVEVPTVQQSLKLLDCTAAVRDALERDQITVSHALKLAKLPPEKQREKVQAVIAAAEGKEGHEKARAQKAALTGDAAPRMRTRKQIAAELEKATGERADALRWVLNLDGDAPTAEAADSRQMSFDEAA
ncbi:hypothetical protein WT72_24265 [Burkholderia pseudomultivorans]|uniref:ParB/RepB/Spo0J family partition protein n=1 Tax=Burkholderia pseudomultivorans TaxID=1207504 RepID=UPI000756CF66|nr:hypothetical protein [Burkholderia pseudomultivorans]KWI50290.1 hypothetical protein WT72_24265 [Burkholderia pseudomultivorans]